MIFWTEVASVPLCRGICNSSKRALTQTGVTYRCISSLTRKRLLMRGSYVLAAVCWRQGPVVMSSTMAAVACISLTACGPNSPVTAVGAAPNAPVLTQPRSTFWVRVHLLLRTFAPVRVTNAGRILCSRSFFHSICFLVSLKGHRSRVPVG